MLSVAFSTQVATSGRNGILRMRSEPETVAVGVSVLQPLYSRLKDKPVSVDLDSFVDAAWCPIGWCQCPHFDDSATLAANPPGHHGGGIRGGAAFPVF